MSRMKAAASLCLAVAAAVLASAPIGTEDVELRDLDVRAGTALIKWMEARKPKAASSAIE